MSSAQRDPGQGGPTQPPEPPDFPGRFIEQKYVAQAPAARLGNDEDLKGLILLRASQASDCMSGQAGSLSAITQGKTMSNIVGSDESSNLGRP